MKKVIEISIGSINFIIEEDAYYRLKDYLSRFEKTIDNRYEAKEVMEDVELRIAEIFEDERKYDGQVVNLDMVNTAINCLGEIENESSDYADTKTKNTDESSTNRSDKRLFRDVDDKKIAGVCSGLSAYFNIDVTLVRVLFFVGLWGGGSTFFLYIILWIVMPQAYTVADKLRMRGLAVTVENIKNYSQGK